MKNERSMPNRFLTQLEEDVVATCLTFLGYSTYLLVTQTNGSYFIGGCLASEKHLTLAKKASNILKAETMQNFIDANAIVTVLETPKLSLVTHGLISQQSVETTVGDHDWDNFYSEYPGCRGLVTVSTVGFDTEKRQALVYIATLRGPLSGEGLWLVCSRNGCWTVAERHHIWDA